MTAPAATPVAEPAEHTFLERILDGIERFGNKMPHPAILFLVLCGIVIVVSHRANALAALNMAMVIYNGQSIAFGPREEVFARVARSAAHAGAAAKQGRPSHLVAVAP